MSDNCLGPADFLEVFVKETKNQARRKPEGGKAKNNKLCYIKATVVTKQVNLRTALCPWEDC